jgi:hypothetical protein
VVKVNVNVKLVLATTAEIVQGVVTNGATHVGVDGRSEANVMGCREMRLWAVTAVVLTV